MKISATFIFSIAVIILSGCTQKDIYVPPVNTIANAASSAQIKSITDKRIETDPYLSQSLVLTEIRESATNDGYKRIQFFFKNCSQATCSFVYRVHWYNNNGTEIESPDNEMWLSRTVIAGDDLMLQTIAPEKDCRDFKLKIKLN
jgi:uncharacterized protein YcfL